MPEEKMGQYKTGEEPKAGDHILGALGGEPAAGQVAAINAKTGMIVLSRLGPSQLHERSGQFMQGQRESIEADPEDFELLYRPAARVKKAPEAPKKEAK